MRTPIQTKIKARMREITLACKPPGSTDGRSTMEGTNMPAQRRCKHVVVSWRNPTAVVLEGQQRGPERGTPAHDGGEGGLLVVERPPSFLDCGEAGSWKLHLSRKEKAQGRA